MLRELLRFSVYRQGEGGGSGGGGDAGSGGGQQTFFKGGSDVGQSGSSSSKAAGAGAVGSPSAGVQGTPPEWTGPDWVVDRFRGAENPVEAQARAYTEADKALKTKRETIAAEMRPEIEESIRGELREGVPDNGAYTYPEGWTPPQIEGLDDRFRGWAQKHNITQDGFSELIDLYAETIVVPDFEAEKAKLGEHADARIQVVNNRGNRAIPEELHGVAAKVMQTAEGFELIEHLLGINNNSFARGGTQTQQPGATTVDEMRAEMRTLAASKDFGRNAEAQKRYRTLSAEIAKKLG